MGVGVNTKITTDSKGWTIICITLDSVFGFLLEEVLGRRDVVWVDEGEDEHVSMCFVHVAAVPRERSVSTKKIATS